MVFGDFGNVSPERGSTGNGQHAALPRRSIQNDTNRVADQQESSTDVSEPVQVPIRRSMRQRKAPERLDLLISRECRASPLHCYILHSC